MKTILHLSDLHFGQEDPRLVEVVLRDLDRLRPDLVAISGDLTQRARRGEFRRARAFLDRIRQPLVIVPGNHDIPFYDVVQRFLRPLRRYKRYIHADLAPMYQDADLAVLGLNTARSRTFKEGRLSLYQIGLIRSRFKPIHEDAMRVLVTHHSFIRPRNDLRSRLIGRHPLALAALKAAGVHLHLAGHFHQGFDDDVRHHHRAYGHSLIVAQAGTAVSRRTRGEPNAYNLLRVGRGRLEIGVRAWDGRAFRARRPTRYRLRDGAWHRLDA